MNVIRMGTYPWLQDCCHLAGCFRLQAREKRAGQIGVVVTSVWAYRLGEEKCEKILERKKDQIGNTIHHGRTKELAKNKVLRYPGQYAILNIWIACNMQLA